MSTSYHPHNDEGLQDEFNDSPNIHHSLKKSEGPPRCRERVQEETMNRKSACEGASALTGTRMRNGGESPEIENSAQFVLKGPSQLLLHLQPLPGEAPIQTHGHSLQNDNRPRCLRRFREEGGEGGRYGARAELGQNSPTWSDVADSPRHAAKSQGRHYM